MLRKKHLNSIDLELRNQVVEMIENDQYYRMYYDESDVDIKRKKQDSVHEKILIKWFEKDIYPNRSIIGNGSVDQNRSHIIVPLLHINKEIQSSYFIPKLYGFMLKGVCYPTVYAAIFDEHKFIDDKIAIRGI